MKKKKSGDGAECLEFQHLRRRTRRENTVSVCGSERGAPAAHAGLIQSQDSGARPGVWTWTVGTTSVGLTDSIRDMAEIDPGQTVLKKILFG